MSGRSAKTRPAARRGQALVEFSAVTFVMIILLLLVVEMGRMVLVSTAVANAARAGLRYAIVHGNDRPSGSTVNSASGPAYTAQILTVVEDFAGTGMLTISRLVVTITYAGTNAPGQIVTVTVVYPYDPLTTYFPATLRLGSAAQGVIVF